MPTLTPLPAGRRDVYCDCGRLASYQLSVRIGRNPRPATIPLCACCAALEARTTPRQLLAVVQVAACSATAR
ncbi:MAG TPA: hypothetical protein PK170_07990 [Anaerolineae bacterium]|nr:hypothetical protein [Anaerolineae bacterium]